MSIHPVHQMTAAPIYKPGLDLTAQAMQNDSHRLEGLAKLMAYHADGANVVGRPVMPPPPASETPVNPLNAEHYIAFVGER